MAKIFLSHSSKDKKFVYRLGEDLRALGHEPWLDEWEIKVGECIPSKIDHAIGEADYVIIILSPEAVESGWVEREWQSKYWDEIEQNKIFVLPVLLKDCKIPNLLKTKKYADFRNNYSAGFVKLMGAISPILGSSSSSIDIQRDPKTTDISALLSDVQSRTTTLSECLAKALDLALKYNFENLENFCRLELSGWEKSNLVNNPEDIPKYRFSEVFIAPFFELNLQYFGWGQNTSAIFDFMRRDTENFYPYKMLHTQSISSIESQIERLSGTLERNIITIHKTLNELMINTSDPDTSVPDHPVRVYGKASDLLGILNATRAELTKMLLDLLPGE